MFDDCIANTGSRLYHLETVPLLHSYQLGKAIDEGRAGRIVALAIPCICMVAETVKIAVDAITLAEMAVASLYHGRVESGNLRTTVLNLSEHGRNIAGIMTGLFVGLYDIKAARRAFLVIESTMDPVMDKAAASRLYATAHALHTFFKEHEIDYRICAGTALGALRHQAVIRWDDDIDLFLHPESVGKVRDLFERGIFKIETGFEAVDQDFTGGWQCFHPASPKGVGVLGNVGTPFVDVFRTRLDGERIAYESARMRQSATGDYITKEEWTAPKEYSLGPLRLTGLANPYSYIRRCYGRDALQFGYKMIPHDLLAVMWENIFDFRGHFEKIAEYGFPRRACIEAESTLPYDKELFNSYNLTNILIQL